MAGKKIIWPIRPFPAKISPPLQKIDNFGHYQNAPPPLKFLRKNFFDKMKFFFP